MELTLKWVTIILSSISAIIGIINIIQKIQKGNKVYLIKTNESSLIQISKLISNKLSITYNGNNINQLFLYDFVLYNNGDKDITNFEMKLLVGKTEGLRFIEYNAYDLGNGVTTFEQDESKKDDKVVCLVIKRPYLNSKKKFKDEEITLQLISDNKLSFHVLGGGESWKIFYLDKKPKSKFIDFLPIGTWLLGLGFLIIPIFWGNNSALFPLIGFFLVILAAFIGEQSKQKSKEKRIG
jgi:hypothetical protein